MSGSLSDSSDCSIESNKSILSCSDMSTNANINLDINLDINLNSNINEVIESKKCAFRDYIEYVLSLNDDELSYETLIFPFINLRKLFEILFGYIMLCDTLLSKSFGEKISPPFKYEFCPEYQDKFVHYFANVYPKEKLNDVQKQMIELMSECIFTPDHYLNNDSEYLLFGTVSDKIKLPTHSKIWLDEIISKFDNLFKNISRQTEQTEQTELENKSTKDSNINEDFFNSLSLIKTSVLILGNIKEEYQPGSIAGIKVIDTLSNKCIGNILCIEIYMDELTNVDFVDVNGIIAKYNDILPTVFTCTVKQFDSGNGVNYNNKSVELMCRVLKEQKHDYSSYLDVIINNPHLCDITTMVFEYYYHILISLEIIEINEKNEWVLYKNYVALVKKLNNQFEQTNVKAKVIERNNFYRILSNRIVLENECGFKSRLL